MSTAVQRLDVSGAVDVAFLVAALPQATVSSLLLHFQWAIWLLQLDICFQFTLVISSMISTWKSLNLKLGFDIGWCVPSCYQEAVKLLLLLFIQNIHSNFFFYENKRKVKSESMFARLNIDRRRQFWYSRWRRRRRPFFVLSIIR